MLNRNPKEKLTYPKIESLTLEEQRELEEGRRMRYEKNTLYYKLLHKQPQAFVEMFDHPTDKSKGWVNKLLMNVKSGGSRATYRSYKYRSLYFLTWLSEYKKHPFSLDVSDAVNFQEYLQGLDVSYKGFPMTNRYRNMILDSVRNMYDYFLLKSCGYKDDDDNLIKLGINPFRKIQNLREDIRIVARYLSKEQLEELEQYVNEHVDKPYYRVAILLGLNAGLRISESVDISFNDVYIKEYDGQKVLVIKVFGKGRKERETIYTDEETKDSLMEYIGNIALEYKKIEETSDMPKSKIEEAGKLVPTSLNDLAKKMYYINGHLDFEFTFHKLRHTYGHRLIEKGIRIEVVGHLMGHSSLETTRIYAEVDTDTAVKEIFGIKQQ